MVEIKIDVDKCISSEIKELNDKSIVTHDSCCGHGGMGYISVRHIDCEKMKQLGYIQMTNNTFKPKSDCGCIPIVKVFQCFECKNVFDRRSAHTNCCAYCGSSKIKLKEIYSIIKIYEIDYEFD